MVAAVDNRLYGLHRSKFVYQCDVFYHSMAAESSTPFLAQSFTEKAAVWPTGQTFPTYSRREHHPCCKSLRTEIPTERLIDLPLFSPCYQLTQPTTMQDLPQSCNCGRNGDPPECTLTDADWLESYLGPLKYDQQQAFAQPSSCMPHWGNQPNLELLATPGRTRDEVPDSLWDLQLHDVGNYQPNILRSPRRSTMQDLSDCQALPPLSIPSLEPHSFPLTPPTSTRGEDASPSSQLVSGQQDFTNKAPQVSPDPSTSVWSGLSIPGRDLMVPPTPQYFPPDMAWSNEEFKNFLQPEPFLSDLDSPNGGAHIQSTWNSSTHSQTPKALQNPGQSITHNQQEVWHNLPLNQLSSCDTYPLVPSASPERGNASVNTTGLMTDFEFDLTNHSLQPEASIDTSSLFDCLSPDIEAPMTRRKSIVKAQQRAIAKDRELIQWKNQGLSYKEIKARGRFQEAESTLRGRYRTLTKPKHLRVRKPEWKQRDVQILLEAVDRHLQHHPEGRNVPQRYMTEAQRRAAKVPWKQVADYMEKRGCYRYGNATVKKKYLEVMDNPLSW